MTIEILHFRCPSCGQRLGEEEYDRACEEITKAADQRVNSATSELQEKMQKEFEEKISEINQKHKIDFEFSVKQEVEYITKEMQSQFDQRIVNENKKNEEQYRQIIADKDKEIESIKLQFVEDIDEKIQEAFKQKEMMYKLRLERIQDSNSDLVAKVSKLQKTLDNIPPELRGTASEIILFDELHKAFPRDVLDPKIVGRKMADVIQTIVTDEGERIETPIVWDRKMGDTVTKTDIEKSKGYKTIHNTDFSIIVTEKGIRDIDSSSNLVAKREEILLVHPSLVIEIAKLLRSFIIQLSRQTKTNKGKTSKRIKLYDLITSAEYARRMTMIKVQKSKLDDIQQKEEESHRKMWKNRKKEIEEWFELDQLNQKMIDEVIEDTETESTENNYNDEKQ